MINDSYVYAIFTFDLYRDNVALFMTYIWRRARYVERIIISHWNKRPYDFPILSVCDKRIGGGQKNATLLIVRLRAIIRIVSGGAWKKKGSLNFNLTYLDVDKNVTKCLFHCRYR